MKYQDKIYHKSRKEQNVYNDLVRDVKKHYPKGTRIPKILIKALEEHLRGLNAECEKECE